MISYDLRTISTKVYTNLSEVKKKKTKKEEHDKQRGQALELYTSVATWGLLRLAGEEAALSNEVEKQAVVRCFFETLGELAFPDEKPNPLVGASRISKLTQMNAAEYLGLTGFALQLAREFSFWTEALYPNSLTNTQNQSN